MIYTRGRRPACRGSEGASKVLVDAESGWVLPRGHQDMAPTLHLTDGQGILQTGCAGAGAGGWGFTQKVLWSPSQSPAPNLQESPSWGFVA